MGIQSNPNTKNKIDCRWCGVEQKIGHIIYTHKLKNKDKFSYPCYACDRRNIVQVGALGFYSLYPADRARYIRNVNNKTNRI
jgi:uncharacterized protein YdeI (YjbR/CyaY-like superfamily)